jgi:hypothetical protein
MEDGQRKGWWMGWGQIPPMQLLPFLDLAEDLWHLLWCIAVLFQTGLLLSSHTSVAS